MVSRHSNFKDSAWLTRGWALQELVAPVNAEFYSYVWECIGTKETLKYEISAITGIYLEVLTGRSQKGCPGQLTGQRGSKMFFTAFSGSLGSICQCYTAKVSGHS